MNPEAVEEIHGSLGWVQCSMNCSDDLYPVDEPFLTRLREEPEWVPYCPRCKNACLRPNVVIFDDFSIVQTQLKKQRANFDKFIEKFIVDEQEACWVVLEIGAGTVVPSIRRSGELYGIEGRGLIRVNPSQNECETLETGRVDLLEDKYFALVGNA